MVDKAASKALGRKLIICGRSINWWDEELRQLAGFNLVWGGGGGGGGGAGGKLPP